MQYKLGKTSLEDIPGLPHWKNAMVEVSVLNDKGKLLRKSSVSVRQDMLNSAVKDLLKEKIRNAVTQIEVRTKAKSILDEVVESLKEDYPDEFK